MTHYSSPFHPIHTSAVSAVLALGYLSPQALTPTFTYIPSRLPWSGGQRTKNSREPENTARFCSRLFFHTPWEKLPQVHPPVYLVADLLVKGALTILYAPSGLGKTEVALTMAHAVANGLPFHNRVTRRTNILYVDYEMGALQLRRYGNRLGLKGLIRAEHDVPYQDLTALIRKAAADGCELVFIDSYASMANQTGNDNAVNSNGVAETVLKPLADLAHSLDIAIVVLHHTNKGSVQYDGSQRILGLSDMMLKLTLSKRTQELEIGPHKTRFQFESLRWDATGHPLLKGGTEDNDEPAQTRLDWIVEHLQAGPCTVDELEEGFEAALGLGRKSLERGLADGVASALISKTKLGRSNQYSLPSPAALA